VDFTALEARTFGFDLPRTPQEFRSGAGLPNSPARIGPAVLNEVLYHPLTGGDEFLELQNRTDAAVALHDPATGRGWRIEGILNAAGTGAFELGPGAAIPPKGYLLVVGIDPDLFRARHPVPAGAQVAGPYGGHLDNAGERLRLFRPDFTQGPGVPYVLVDEVRYNDRPPWPESAAGDGFSLERVRSGEYGNDPVNWRASVGPGGTPGRANSASAPPGAAGLQLPGDGNQDGRLDLGDAIALLFFLYEGGSLPLPCAGDLPTGQGNRTLLDLDGDRTVGLTDAVHLLNYLFLAGPAPVLGTLCLPIAGCPGACSS
jgi:hypothetical protein